MLSAQVLKQAVPGCKGILAKEAVEGNLCLTRNFIRFTLYTFHKEQTAQPRSKTRTASQKASHRDQRSRVLDLWKKIYMFAALIFFICETQNQQFASRLSIASNKSILFCHKNNSFFPEVMSPPMSCLGHVMFKKCLDLRVKSWLHWAKLGPLFTPASSESGIFVNWVNSHPFGILQTEWPWIHEPNNQTIIESLNLRHWMMTIFSTHRLKGAKSATAGSILRFFVFVVFKRGFRLSSCLLIRGMKNQRRICACLSKVPTFSKTLDQCAAHRGGSSLVRLVYPPSTSAKKTRKNWM